MSIKLSIITINYNNASGLRKTMESVFAQTCKDFEYIVVDGASTDGSVDVIREYDSLNAQCSTLNTFTWVSEPDTGIYNAMNKGIRLSKGDYLLFLNSGDVLQNSQVVYNFSHETVSADIATGIESFSNGRLKPAPTDSQLSYEFFYEDTLMHQSSFIRRESFYKYGMYREDYRIVSDWEWFFRVIVRDGASYQPLNFVVAEFDENGLSRSQKFMDLQEREREQVHQEILPRVRKDYDELFHLRAICLEYEHLRNGKFGPIVNLFLNLKGIRKK